MGFLSLLIFDPTCSCKNRLNWHLCQDLQHLIVVLINSALATLANYKALKVKRKSDFI